MHGTKLAGPSHHLGRRFHLDHFRVGHQPAFQLLLFGGSGVGRAEYAAREDRLVAAFDGALGRLERELSFAFIFVTAPFDVRFNAFEEEPSEAERWTRHVEEEVLPLLPALPLYLAGYSGGAALALGGPHLSPRCFGVGALGGDALAAHVEAGPAWKGPATLLYNREDRVWGRNRPALDALTEAGVASVHRQRPGAHALADYLANESFSGLVRRAARTWASGSAAPS